MALLWGYNWVVTEIALRCAELSLFAALRSFVGAAFLFLLWRGDVGKIRGWPCAATLYSFAAGSDAVEKTRNTPT